MAVCHCQVCGCGAKNGVTVDPHTLKSHQRADNIEFACEASKRIISAQEDDIAAYLASMTLSDKVSGASSEQGGHMWSRGSPSNTDMQTITDNLASTLSELLLGSPNTTCFPKPSQRAVTTALIQRLSEIDTCVDKLAKDSTSLSRLEYSSGSTYMPFPLKGLLVTCDSLGDDLHRVKSKVPSAIEFQRSIKEKLNEARDSITKAQRQWRTSQSQSRADQASSCGINYNTGKSLLYWILKTCIEMVFQITISNRCLEALIQ
jgi:hypothetical protein